MKRKAVVAGATGLVGKELVRLLLAEEAYGEVTLLVRRPVGLAHSKLRERIVDFDLLASSDIDLAGADVYCTLGTTIKRAGTQAAFRLVDYTYPLTLGQLAKDQGADQYLIITSIGANPSSRTFYIRVKGEVERDLRSLGLARLHLFRPSLLLGKREEFRLGERLMGALLPLVSALMGKYRPIQAQAVAQAMIHAAKGRQSGIHIYESAQMIGKANS